MATGGIAEEYDLSGVLIPCEFCEELFPMDLLLEHTTGCRPDLCAHAKNNDDASESDDDLDHLINTVQAIPKHFPNETDVTKITNPTVEIANVKKETPVMPKPENLLETNFSPVKNSNDEITYLNLETRKVADVTQSAAETKDLNKRNPVSALNNTATKPNNYKTAVGFNFNNNIQNNFSETSTAEDEVLTSDDDDNFETIESFWRRAAPVLKKRLQNYDAKSPQSLQITNMTGQPYVPKNAINVNLKKPLVYKFGK